MYTLEEFLCDRVCFWGMFHVQEVERYCTHPVISLVKYTPGVHEYVMSTTTGTMLLRQLILYPTLFSRHLKIHIKWAWNSEASMKSNKYENMKFMIHFCEAAMINAIWKLLKVTVTLQAVIKKLHLLQLFVKRYQTWSYITRRRIKCRMSYKYTQFTW